MKCKITLLLILSILIVPIKLLSNENPMNKTDRLEKVIIKLTNKLNRIYINSQKVKVISIKYKKIAEHHLSIVSKFTEQKSNCLNLENTYKEEQKKQILDRRVVKKQGENIIECYEVLETLTYFFDKINQDFSKLRISIDTLQSMSETDKASLMSLEKQMKSIKSLIKIEKSKSI